jgi:hypothetical protein
MFVQVIQGSVTGPAEVHAALDRWAEQLSPDAVGWLGTTAGVSADHRFIAVVRFDSEDAARRNSDRSEQDEWWARTSKLFSDEPVFSESTEIDVDLQGDPDQAGFVQVISGRSSDPARARELMGQDSDAWAAFRPDILGSVGVGLDDNRYIAVLYFTSESEAREGERKEPPPELRAQMEAMGALEVGEPSFLDLTEPWLYSPR